MTDALDGTAAAIIGGAAGLAVDSMHGLRLRVRTGKEQP